MVDVVEVYCWLLLFVFGCSIRYGWMDGWMDGGMDGYKREK